MMRWCLLICLGLLPVFTASASSGGVPSVPELKTLYSARVCYGVERGGSVNLLSKAQWQSFLKAQPRAPELDEAAVVGPIVLVNMGEQRTAGYAIGLAPGPVQVENGTLRLPVIWQTPKPGMMQAQMITHPCLVVSVAAEIQRVDIVDQDGNTRLSTGTP